MWRIGAPTVGRAAPGLTGRYYDSVTRSLVRALAREPRVRAVYAHGSYAEGDLVPGRSDVDLVVVVDDLPAGDEALLLQRLRRSYRRRQAILPLDLVALGAGELERGAGWFAFGRARIGGGSSHSAVAGWRLLHGEELRSPGPWEPPRALRYLTETDVAEALAAGPNAGRRLALLAGDLEREGLDSSRLRGADPVAAVLGALEVVDEHRGRHAVETGSARYDTSGWRVERPAPADRAAAARLAARLAARSATLVCIPFEPHAALLLETEDAEEARPLIAAALWERRLPMLVTTTRLAEDSWRSRFRWIAIATGEHLAGEPLAPRLREPDAPTRRLLLEHRAYAAAASVRRFALGMRTAQRRPSAVLDLALAARLAHGEPPVTIEEELAPGAAALGDEAWILRALQLWLDARASLVRKEDAFGAHSFTVH